MKAELLIICGLFQLQVITSESFKIEDAVNDIPLKIQGAVNDIPSKIQDAANDIPLKVQNAVKDIPSKIQDAANDVPKRITEEFPAMLEHQKILSFPSVINKVGHHVNRVWSDTENILPIFVQRKTSSRLSNPFRNFLDIGRGMVGETPRVKRQLKRDSINKCEKKCASNSKNSFQYMSASDNYASSSIDSSDLTDYLSKLNSENSFSSNDLQNREETVQTLKHKSVPQNIKEQFLNFVDLRHKRSARNSKEDKELLEMNSAKAPMNTKHLAYNNIDKKEKFYSFLRASSQTAEPFLAPERKRRSVLFNIFKPPEIAESLFVNKHQKLNRGTSNQLQTRQKMKTIMEPFQFLSPLQSKTFHEENENNPALNSNAFKETFIRPLQKEYFLKSGSFGHHTSVNNPFMEGKNLLSQAKDGSILTKDAHQIFNSVQKNIIPNGNANPKMFLQSVENTVKRVPNRLKENFIPPKDKMFHKGFDLKMLDQSAVKKIGKDLINQFDIQADMNLRTDLSKIQDKFKSRFSKTTGFDKENPFGINLKTEIELNSSKPKEHNLMKDKARSEYKRYTGNSYTEVDLSANQEKDSILRSNQINSDQNVTKQISNAAKKTFISEMNGKRPTSNSTVRKQDNNIQENREEDASKQNETLLNAEAIEGSHMRNITRIDDDTVYKSSKDEQKDLLFRSFGSRYNFRDDLLNYPMADHYFTFPYAKFKNLRKFEKSYKKDAEWHDSKHFGLNFKRNNHNPDKKEKLKFLSNSFDTLDHIGKHNKKIHPFKSTLSVNAHIHLPNKINIPDINLKNSKNIFETFLSTGEDLKKKFIDKNHFGNEDSEPRYAYQNLMPSSSLRKYSYGLKKDEQSQVFPNKGLNPPLKSTSNEAFNNTGKSEKLLNGPVKQSYSNKKNIDSLNRKNEKPGNEILDSSKRKPFVKYILTTEKTNFRNNIIKSDNKNGLISSFGNLFQAIKTKTKSILGGLWNGITSVISGKKEISKQKTSDNKLFPKASDNSIEKTIHFQFKPKIEPDISSKYIGGKEKIKSKNTDKFNLKIPPLLDTPLKKLRIEPKMENNKITNTEDIESIRKIPIAYNGITKNKEASSTVRTSNIPIHQDYARERNSKTTKNYFPTDKIFQKGTMHHPQKPNTNKLKIKPELQNEEKFYLKDKSKITEHSIDLQNRTSPNYLFREVKKILPLSKVPNQPNTSHEKDLMSDSSGLSNTHIQSILPKMNSLVSSIMNEPKMRSETEDKEIVIIKDSDIISDLKSRSNHSAIGPNSILNESQTYFNSPYDPVQRNHSHEGKSFKRESTTILNNNLSENNFPVTNPLKNSEVRKSGLRAEPVNKKIILPKDEGSFRSQISNKNVDGTIYHNFPLNENQEAISLMQEYYPHTMKPSRENYFVKHTHVKDVFPEKNSFENFTEKKPETRADLTELNIILKDEDKSSITDIFDKDENIASEPFILHEDHKTNNSSYNPEQQERSSEEELGKGFTPNNNFINDVLPIIIPLENTEISNTKSSTTPEDMGIILLKGTDRSTIPEINSRDIDTKINTKFIFDEVHKALNPFDDYSQKDHSNKRKSLKNDSFLNNDFIEEVFPVTHMLGYSEKSISRLKTEPEDKKIILLKDNNRSIIHEVPGISDEATESLDLITKEIQEVLYHSSNNTAQIHHSEAETPADEPILSNNLIKDALTLRNVSENSKINNSRMRTNPVKEVTLFKEDEASIIPEISVKHIESKFNSHFPSSKNHTIVNPPNDSIKQDNLKVGSFFNNSYIEDSLLVKNTSESFRVSNSRMRTKPKDEKINIFKVIERNVIKEIPGMNNDATRIPGLKENKNSFNSSIQQNYPYEGHLSKDGYYFDGKALPVTNPLGNSETQKSKIKTDTPINRKIILLKNVNRSTFSKVPGRNIDSTIEPNFTSNENLKDISTSDNSLEQTFSPYEESFRQTSTGNMNLLEGDQIVTNIIENYGANMSMIRKEPENAEIIDLLKGKDRVIPNNDDTIERNIVNVDVAMDPNLTLNKDQNSANPSDDIIVEDHSYLSPSWEDLSPTNFPHEDFSMQNPTENIETQTVNIRVKPLHKKIVLLKAADRNTMPYIFDKDIESLLNTNSILNENHYISNSGNLVQQDPLNESKPEEGEIITNNHNEINTIHETPDASIEAIGILNLTVNDSSKAINFINRPLKQSLINRQFPWQFLNEGGKLRKDNTVLLETSNNLNFRNNRENKYDEKSNFEKIRYYIVFGNCNSHSNKSENSNFTEISLVHRNKTDIAKNSTSPYEPFQLKSPIENIYLKEERVSFPINEPEEPRGSINEFQNSIKNVENVANVDNRDNKVGTGINVYDPNIVQVSKHQVTEKIPVIKNNNLNQSNKHLFLIRNSEDFSNFSSFNDKVNPNVNEDINSNQQDFLEALKRKEKYPKINDDKKNSHTSIYDSFKVELMDKYLLSGENTFENSYDLSQDKDKVEDNEKTKIYSINGKHFKQAINHEISLTEENKSETELTESWNNYTPESKDVVFSRVYQPSDKAMLENSPNTNRADVIINSKHIPDTSSVEQIEPDTNEYNEILQYPTKKNIISYKSIPKMDAELENNRILKQKMKDRNNIEEIKPDVIDGKFFNLHTSQNPSTMEYNKVTETEKSEESKYDPPKRFNGCNKKHKYPRSEPNSKATLDYTLVIPKNKNEIKINPKVEKETISGKNKNLEKNVPNSFELVNKTFMVSSLFSTPEEVVSEEIIKIVPLYQHFELNPVDSLSEDENKKLLRTFKKIDEIKNSDKRKGILKNNTFYNRLFNLDDNEVNLENLEPETNKNIVKEVIHTNDALPTNPEKTFDGQNIRSSIKNGNIMRNNFRMTPVSANDKNLNFNILMDNNSALRNLNQSVVSKIPDKVFKVENDEDFVSEIPEKIIDNGRYKHHSQASKISPRFIGKSSISGHQGYFKNKNLTYSDSTMKGLNQYIISKYPKKNFPMDNNYNYVHNSENLSKIFTNNRNLDDKQKIIRLKNKILNDRVASATNLNPDSANEKNEGFENSFQSNNKQAIIYEIHPEENILSKLEDNNMKDNFENIEHVVKNKELSSANSAFLTNSNERFIDGVDMNHGNKVSLVNEIITNDSISNSLPESDIDLTYEDSSGDNLTDTFKDFFSKDSSEDSSLESDTNLSPKDDSEGNIFKINFDLLSDDISETITDLSTEDELIQNPSPSRTKKVAPCCKHASKVLKMLSGRKNKTFSKKAVKCFCTYCSKFFSNLDTNPFEESPTTEKRKVRKTRDVSPKVYWTRAMWLTLQYGDLFNSCQVIYSQFGLAIHQNDHQARRRFVEWAQNEIAVVPDFHKRILFSDEAHFWLNGYVNKQNCRIWSEANPQVYVETPLHPEKLTVWCALWVGGILLQKR
ncbi:uncharacterized protein TNCV_3650331 [Trichonephila clavipes]|uniref:Uncharacterized protein n=1 Tax=Trichonephila clavipes TaxID=2585209 RepID=A0A8X6S6Q0_TRICX|nr:uncharacterized protein TNCV_3650331 [Trichonephila clavipes]